MPASNIRKQAKGRKTQRAWQVEISNRHVHRIPRAWIARAVQATLETDPFDVVDLSIAVVGDAEMRRLNRDYLRHDYATDVLSFPLEFDRRQRRLAGEIVVSADTARRTAAKLGGSARGELVLYVVHGTLHLLGHADHAPQARRRMRHAEQAVFRRIGLPLPPQVDSAADAI